MSTKCPNCGKTVYFAEEVRAIGLSWHARCLKCSQCNKALDAGNINDRNGKVYCKPCYSSVAGLKGFGHGVASESSVSGGASGKATYANAPIEHESALAKGYSDGFADLGSNEQAARNPSSVPAPQLDQPLLPVPRIHSQPQTQQQQRPQQGAPQPATQAPSASTGEEGYSLVNDGDWVYFDINLAMKGKGHGAAALKAILPPADCGFAFWRIVRANVGNSGPDVITEANVVLQYKGPQTNAIKKVKSNTALDAAQKKCPAPYKGFIEVLTNGQNLTDENIFDRWKPGSGSKVIDA
eukprot:TRINITY_DN719_c0_g1_i1.p1 TRINITY_DN719_c0_g1~~TRINITY_DN719_c0_g1_i1.p1  ORF type:complete len:308 (-),score=66.88 TRINITY_DN719_c0_g1_i1:176-1063(-)